MSSVLKPGGTLYVRSADVADPRHELGTLEQKVRHDPLSISSSEIERITELETVAQSTSNWTNVVECNWLLAVVFQSQGRGDAAAEALTRAGVAYERHAATEDAQNRHLMLLAVNADIWNHPVLRTLLAVNPKLSAQYRTLCANLAGNPALHANVESFYAAHADEGRAAFSSAAAAAPVPRGPSEARGARGGCEVECYGFTVTSPNPLSFGALLAESPHLVVSVEYDMDKTGFCIEVSTKVQPVGSARARAAMHDLGVFYTVMKEVTESGGPVSLSVLMEQLKSRLKAPLQSPSAGRERDDPTFMKSKSTWGYVSDPTTVFIGRHPDRPPHDVWVQQSVSSSHYPFAFPALLHTLVDADNARASLATAALASAGSASVPLVESHEAAYPVRAKIERMHVLSAQARKLMAAMAQELKPAHAKDLKPERHCAKLIGFFAQIAQWLAFPSSTMPETHPDHKDRVLVLPHTHLQDIATYCLSAKDRQFLDAWCHSNPRESLAKRIVRGLGLGAEFSHDNPDEQAVATIRLADFLTKQLQKGSAVSAYEDRAMFQPGARYYGVNEPVDDGDPGAPGSLPTFVVELRNATASFAAAFHGYAPDALGAFLSAELVRAQNIQNPSKESRAMLRRQLPPIQFTRGTKRAAVFPSLTVPPFPPARPAALQPMVRPLPPAVPPAPLTPAIPPAPPTPAVPPAPLTPAASRAPLPTAPLTPAAPPAPLTQPLPSQAQPTARRHKPVKKIASLPPFLEQFVPATDLRVLDVPYESGGRLRVVSTRGMGLMAGTIGEQTTMLLQLRGSRDAVVGYAECSCELGFVTSAHGVISRALVSEAGEVVGEYQKGAFQFEERPTTGERYRIQLQLVNGTVIQSPLILVHFLRRSGTSKHLAELVGAKRKRDA